MDRRKASIYKLLKFNFFLTVFYLYVSGIGSILNNYKKTKNYN